MGLQEVTGGNKGSQWVTRDYRRFQGAIRSYGRLHEV